MKRPPLKRRLVRWLDNLSRKIRDRLEEKSETHTMSNPPLPGSPLDELNKPGPPWPHLRLVKRTETKTRKG